MLLFFLDIQNKEDVLPKNIAVFCEWQWKSVTLQLSLQNATSLKQININFSS